MSKTNENQEIEKELKILRNEFETLQNDKPKQTFFKFFAQIKPINFQILQYLIENGENFIYFHLSPLHYLCSNPSLNEEMMRILIEKGANFIASSYQHKKPIENCSNILKKYYESSPSFAQDFQHFFQKKEFCDSKILNFPVHKLILSNRLSISTEKLQNILRKYSEKEQERILLWIYSGTFKKIPDQPKKDKNFHDKNERKEEDRISILGEIGITNPRRRYFHEDLAKLYTQEETKDFTIEVEGKEIKAHKLILQVRSQTFRNMFISVNDDSNRTKDFSGKSFDSLNLFIKFLYTDKITDEDYNENIQKHGESFDFDFEFFLDYFELNPKSTLLYYQEKFLKK
ncbi:btb/poz domain-containing protein [Anaeramoeba ignava]|uniref:Btb/poz domain-containing protein n=1 Tax=Anaeramoeba ignava TaxID=1746090 RepID=A0A9Q0RCA4_ANAIG|nr:btb/poz domain-containing protein [Anaeramoeba ignava]